VSRIKCHPLPRPDTQSVKSRLGLAALAGFCREIDCCMIARDRWQRVVIHWPVCLYVKRRRGDDASQTGRLNDSGLAIADRHFGGRLSF